MIADPRRTPSAWGEYPQYDRALAPDLGEDHPRVLQQIYALRDLNEYRHDEEHYHGPPVRAVAQIHCARKLHLPGMSREIGLVVRIGEGLVYFASIPDVHVNIPPIEARRDDFQAVRTVQWIWGLDWPEVDRLQGYCADHHDTELWLDRYRIRTEIERSQPPRHGHMLSLQLERVALISS